MPDLKILVFGASGFIGTHVASAMLNSNRLAGAFDLSETNPQFTPFYFPFSEIKKFLPPFLDQGIDVIINCAGSASVPLSFENPLRDYTQNTQLVVEILEVLRTHSPKTRLINLSSAAVYGNPLYLPVKEDHVCSPISPYGYNKWISEQICREYSSIYGIKTCCIRIFSAYGPGLRKQLFWDLYSKYLVSEGSKITLFGTGKESRDFIYISDLVRAIELLIENDLPFPLVNLGSGKEIAIEHAVKIFYSSYNDVNFEFSGEQKVGDPQRWVADISKLESIGFQASVDLEEGLKQYQQWLKGIV